MIFFPNNEEENSLLKFISQYQYLKTSDEKYLFTSNGYYRKRIKNLMDKKLIRKYKSYLILDEIGIEYVKLNNFEYHSLNTNKKYQERIFRLSNIGAFFHNSKTVKFTPSFSIKDKRIFTTTARKFIRNF